MNIRKYLFWLEQDGIRTYKMMADKTFKLVRYHGEEICAGVDLPDFLEWFDKTASITKDEFVDFCFLADREIDISLSAYQTMEISSWNKAEILAFCRDYMGDMEACKFFYQKEKCFVCQNGNIFDEKNIKKLYVKCIPKFSCEVDEVKEGLEKKTEESSGLTKYYHEKLDKTRNRKTR